MHHHLSPTNRDNLMSPGRASLVVGIIEGCEIDIAKIIAWDIRDQSISTNTDLTFLYLYNCV